MLRLVNNQNWVSPKNNPLAAHCWESRMEESNEDREKPVLQLEFSHFSNVKPSLLFLLPKTLSSIPPFSPPLVHGPLHQLICHSLKEVLGPERVHHHTCHDERMKESGDRGSGKRNRRVWWVWCGITDQNLISEVSAKWNENHPHRHPQRLFHVHVRGFYELRTS